MELSVAREVTPARRQLVPARWRLSIVCSFAGFFGYTQRYGLALAIVRMQAQLGWDRSTQGGVLAAFFLGYMVAQLPAGYAAVRFGPRRTIFAGLLVSSMINLLLPAAATHSPWSVAALRVVQGLAQGILFPGFAAVWSHWAPPMERSQLDGMPRAGAFCGAMACNALGGLQCESAVSPWLFGGWQGVFSLWGVAGALYACAWWHLVADTPAEACASAAAMRRTGCTHAERALIKEALSETLLDGGGGGGGSSSTDPDSSGVNAGGGGAGGSSSSSGGGGGGGAATGAAAGVPPCSIYATIARSPAVWAITLAHTMNDAALYMLDDGLPPCAAHLPLHAACCLLHTMPRLLPGCRHAPHACLCLLP